MNLNKYSDLELSKNLDSYDKITKLDADNTSLINLIFCIGGDGTLLWTNK